MTIRQVILFLLVLGIFTYAYLNEEVRERIVSNSWSSLSRRF